MANWRIRYEGSPTVVEVESPQKVVEGLRDGEWEPSDEVRGPGDAAWTTIEDHPQFAEAVAEMEPPPGEKPDETRLDMNPLIDVALVLLIFFILTTTYTSLRRSIEVPAEPEKKEGQQAKVTQQDIQDRTFRVEAWMADDRPRVKVGDKVVEIDEVEKEVKALVASTGKREMLLEVDGKVPWGIEAQIHDAAKAAEIHQIWRKPKRTSGV